MSHVEVHAGICGQSTTIEAHVADDGQTVRLKIESACEHITRLAGELGEVDAFQEISFRKGPRTLSTAAKCLPHPACPVPSGIIKAVEVAAGLALPKDATISVTR